MSADDGLTVRSPLVELWPQGGPSDCDGVTPDGRTGYLNEQVLWIRHARLQDSRCLLRIPEGVSWEGKHRLAPSALSKDNHHYQIGQQWSLSGNGLEYRDCPVTNMFGESPGRVSARVELVDDEIVEIGLTVESGPDRPMNAVSAHVCFNHRRSPMLGRRLYVRAASGWVDFRQYHQFFGIDSDFIRYDLRGGNNPSALPEVTEPLLFSETVHENGGSFVSVIGSRDALAIASNIVWPCTDATLDFGDLRPGERVRRDLFIGLGPGSRDDWLDRLTDLL